MTLISGPDAGYRSPTLSSPVVGGGVAIVLEVGPVHRGGAPAIDCHQAAHPEPDVTMIAIYLLTISNLNSPRGAGARGGAPQRRALVAGVTRPVGPRIRGAGVIFEGHDCEQGQN